MHLPRLWTDAPVAKKTQVNSTTNQNGTDRKGGATNRSRPEQKGPNRADKGGQNKKTRRPKGNEVKRGVRPRRVEGRKRWVMSDSVECIQDGGVCLLGEYHSSYFRWQRRPVSLLRSLQPSDVRRCMQRRTQRCQDPVLFCVVSDLGRLALAHAVAKSVPVHNKLVVGTTLCWLA